MEPHTTEGRQTPEYDAWMSRDAIMSLVEFWRGESSHFTPLLGEGQEYITLLETAVNSPFILSGLTTSSKLQQLIEEAQSAIEEISRTECAKYNEWLQRNPGQIVVESDGQWSSVGEVVVVERDIFPVVGGQALTDIEAVQWLDEEES